MRKLLLIFIVNCISIVSLCNISGAQITTSAYVTADDITVLQLEQNRIILTNAINSADGSLLQTGSIAVGALDDNASTVKRWDEAFNDFVFTGLVPPTSSDLTAITTSGTAYVDGTRVVKDATSRTYTASKHTYVDISSSGTYTYSEVNINGSEPSVAANSIRIARVSTDGTLVLSVVDRRITQISAGKYKKGSFTRDISLSSGSQVITGVGFKPSAIWALAGLDSPATVFSYSFGDGANSTGSVSSSHEDTADTVRTDANFLIADLNGANQYLGIIDSFDDDGFTIGWTKVGVTTGILSVSYIVAK